MLKCALHICISKKRKNFKSVNEWWDIIRLNNTLNMFWKSRSACFFSISSNNVQASWKKKKKKKNYSGNHMLDLLSYNLNLYQRRRGKWINTCWFKSKKKTTNNHTYFAIVIKSRSIGVIVKNTEYMLDEMRCFNVDWCLSHFFLGTIIKQQQFFFYCLIIKRKNVTSINCQRIRSNIFL